MAQPQQYTMLKACCGIITDEGGILSHAAIVSRELGIPCVVGVTGATKTIEEGATITIVAEGPDRGTIRVITKSSDSQGNNGGGHQAGGESKGAA